MNHKKNETEPPIGRLAMIRHVAGLVVLLTLVSLCVGGLYVLYSKLDPSPWRSPRDTPSIICREFDYQTDRGETCRVLWCEQAVGNASRGGATILGCAPPDAGDQPAVRDN